MGGFTLYNIEQQSKWGDLHFTILNNKANGGNYTLQFCTTKQIGGFTLYNFKRVIYFFPNFCFLFLHKDTDTDRLDN